MLYHQGTLRAEDRALRQIARKKIHLALQSIEEKIKRLVDMLLKKLTPQVESFFTIETLLESILRHPALAMETATIEHYSCAFPELQEKVNQRRELMKTHTRTRIENALVPLQTSRRFRFAKGWRDC